LQLSDILCKMAGEILKRGKSRLSPPLLLAAYLIPVSSLLPSHSSLTRFHPSRGFILISLRRTILRDNLTTFLSPSSIRSLANPSFIIISTPLHFPGTWCKYLKEWNKTELITNFRIFKKLTIKKTIETYKKNLFNLKRDKNIIHLIWIFTHVLIVHI